MSVCSKRTLNTSPASSNTHAQPFGSVGFVHLSPNLPQQPSLTISRSSPWNPPLTTRKLAFNVDAAAIVIALTFAALIRLNIIHHIRLVTHASPNPNP